MVYPKKRIRIDNLKKRTLCLVILLFGVSTIFSQSHGKKTAKALNIRAVDFKNYAYSLAGRRSRIKAGTKVEPIIYGDLTGDGKEDAVVIERFPFSHGEKYSQVSVYTMQNSRVLCLPMMEIDGTGPYDCGLSGTDANPSFSEFTGSRGIASASISKGELLLRRYNNSTGRPVFIETWRFKWNGNRLVPIGKN